MPKFAVIFDVPEDMTAEEIKKVIETAFEYAYDDYSECLEISRGYSENAEVESYQSKIDGQERLGNIQEVVQWT